MSYLYGFQRQSADWYVCGLYFVDTIRNIQTHLPVVSASVHSQIIGTTSRSVLTQTFVNPQDTPIPQLRYTFPLYDGVSVTGFVCTINKDRIIRGTVKEREQARQTFQAAVERGETAALLEQLPKASDVFTTTVGNVPAGAEIKVEITYLGELKHDAETDGIRFTIPTKIAPRYGVFDNVGRTMLSLPGTYAVNQKGIEIVVDAEMPKGSNIKSVQSPSHPISVTIGNTSLSTDAEMSLQKASATLSLGTAELDKDFVVHVVATNTSNPVAVLETHPTIPNQRALMATLVPKFNLPPSRPEIVFVCDRSGSMGSNIANLKASLRIFLKSLPLGVKFNICSFGSHYEFLFKEGSQSYDATTLEQAEQYVETFGANFGGTEMYRPIEETFLKRYKDMSLEVFLLTDGEIWDQEKLFGLINKHVEESKGEIRLFTLGIGNGVSHALIEGVARAGNGFAQTVGDNEKMNAKVLRMLKASLSPHIKDYTLEVKYGSTQQASTDDDDFEIIEKVMDSLSIEVAQDPAAPKPAAAPAKPISLFDTSADPDTEMVDASLDHSAGGKYAHVPAVSEPKILQAPFNIPPLYPFSRTSVYLLLSAQAPQKEIKSVVLRGTSAHRPLELEIPVTTLPQKGETIHQLAARKAVKELEEGRGWIYHAKDSKANDGKLLKEKFVGRFSDMVEREAVRLGVTFQVGGKWCSFVAVEENLAEKEQKEREKEQERVTKEQQLAEETPAPNAPRAPGSLFGGGGGSRRSAGGGSVQFHAFGGPQPQFQMQQTQSRRMPAPAPTGGALFGMKSGSARGGGLFGSTAVPPPPPGSGGGGLFGSIGSTAVPPPPPGGGLFGAAAAPARLPRMARATAPEPEYSENSFSIEEELAPALAPPSAVVDADLLKQYESKMNAAACMPLCDEDDDLLNSSDDEDCGFGLMDGGGGNYLAPAVEALQRTSANFSTASDTTAPQASFQAHYQGQQAQAQAQAQSQQQAQLHGVNRRNQFMTRGRVDADDDFDLGSRADRSVCKKSKSGGEREYLSSRNRDSESDRVMNASVTLPTDTRDTFEKIVAWQSFAGSWTSSNELMRVMGLGNNSAELHVIEKKMEDALKSMPWLKKEYGQNVNEKDRNLVATALVIAFLEKKMIDRKDEWELLVEKAKDWIKGELTSFGGQAAQMEVEEFVSKVGVVFD